MPMIKPPIMSQPNCRYRFTISIATEGIVDGTAA
jgi:hypothetical protein